MKSSSWAYLVILVILAGMLFLSSRNRRRQAAAEAQRVERIAVGAQVMTTSGLYGTVVARNDDETVQLSVAPGVELKWALAALRAVVPPSPDGPTTATNSRSAMSSDTRSTATNPAPLTWKVQLVSWNEIFVFIAAPATGSVAARRAATPDP